MRNIIPILLAALVLFQAFGKVWIFFSFKINQDYIARVLCINRDKPELHCNGKCILMQRIKAEEEKERKEMSQKLKEQKEVVFCFEYFSRLVESLGTQIINQKKNFQHQTPFIVAFVKGIFRPPKFIPAQQV